jgi:hypothetical protein
MLILLYLDLRSVRKVKGESPRLFGRLNQYEFEGKEERASKYIQSMTKTYFLFTESIDANLYTSERKRSFACCKNESEIRTEPSYKELKRSS